MLRPIHPAGFRIALGFCLCVWLAIARPSAQSIVRTPLPAGFAPIADLVNEAIARHDLPGAVVLVGQGRDVLFHHAFGRRAVLPSPEAMTEDTIFDIASLTKVVATTTSVMQLVERGRIRLSDRVVLFIPGFDRFGKDGVTIRHLLTHTSGLRPDLDLDVEFTGQAEAIRRAIDEHPVAAPDE